MKQFTLILLISMVLYACKPKEEITPPIASFSVSNNNCQASCAVSFQNTSTGDNLDTYLWDFGDGTSSNTRDAVHSYTTAGDYTVTLTVINSAGKSNATQQLVNIKAAPSLVPTKCRFKTVTLTEFPFYMPGNNTPWDWLTGNDGEEAECSFSIKDDLGYMYVSSGTTHDIVNTMLPVLYQAANGMIVNSIAITNFQQNYRFRFWDVDANGTGEVIHDFTIKFADYYPSNNQVGETQFTVTQGGFGNASSTQRLTAIVVLEWYN